MRIIHLYLHLQPILNLAVLVQ